jgi:primosomal protein N' (replication factor Y)
MFVDVAVPVPLTHVLTYGAPASLGPITPGARVLVPLGPRRIVGVAVGTPASLPVDTSRIKDVLEILDHEPAVPPELLRFLLELASYYLAPIGEVLRLAVPPLEREQASSLELRGLAVPGTLDSVGGRRVRWAVATDALEAPGTLRGAAAQILARLRAEGATPVARLAELWSTARPAIAKLETAGLVRLEEREVPRDPYFRAPIDRDVAPEATPAQADAGIELEAALERGAGAFLLHGVTGSGKTEVYLRAIAAASARGKGSLVMVPEIALTPQLVQRFRARFGDELAVLHSGLDRRDRHAMWHALRRGDVQVAIGARSALFAPVPSLGLIVVDEEHDPSFKQEEGVRYQARDMALLRAHRAGGVCVLGSATPSLETEQLARTKKVVRLELPARAHVSAVLPQVMIVDLRRTAPGPTGDKRLSLVLHREMEKTLARGEQVILFLNRRGFAPSVVCEGCGTVVTCPYCSVALTFHRREGSVRCHYCDHATALPKVCVKCGSNKLTLEGLGTEKLEETIQKAFPAARVARLDRDVAAGAKAEKILDRLRRREIDVLVGTQMVAKGHDVPSVTLVGVVNADAALSMPDFRASERSFQLLVQVAGRAGRGDVRGTVVFQTRDPSHPAIVAAAAHDVTGFAERELREREELSYPPFTRAALVRVDDPDETRAREGAAALADAARATDAGRSLAVTILGPAPAPIARLRGRFRFQLLLKGRERKSLRQVLLAVMHARSQLPRSVRAIVDVDPVSML